MMGTHRLRLTIVASLCGLVCALATGAVADEAGATQFGSNGEGAGQLDNAQGLGLDHETGDVYVGEFYNQRVSKFDGSGSFLFAWGWGVDATSSAHELQICTETTECMKSGGGSGAGDFADGCGAQAVAVDNDPLSSSYKDVYVTDFCNYRVQKFDSSGKFLLSFGGHVNQTTGGNVCVAGEVCTQGTVGTATGEFEWAYPHSAIAVGPDGTVYVGDRARVQVFEPTGAWKESISLSGLSPAGRVTALAVDSTGDTFVADEGVSGVREFEPGGTEKPVQFDAGSTAVEAITLDEAGDLFVADSTGGFHIAEYGPSANELASFGSKGVAGTQGIVFSDTLDELYVSQDYDVTTFTPPAPGPLVEPGSESATPELRGAATLRATVNPEGGDTHAHFEYVNDARYQESGFTGAISTAPVSLGSSFDEQPIEAKLPSGTLVPGVSYHWRVVADDTEGHVSESTQGSFQEIPPALIEGPWAINAAATSVTLTARVDPLGASTTYRLEYGTGASYGHVISSGSVGEGMEYVPIASRHLQELEPGTTYHYRVVTTSEVGTVEGEDHTFTTQPAGGNELTLPDGRAWELVSPANKNGALIEPPEGSGGEMQAAGDGSGITYISKGPSLGENPAGKSIISQALSIRGDAGWKTQDLSVPLLLPEGENTASHQLYFESGDEYMLFSTSLSSAIMEPGTLGVPPLSPEATERTTYLRDNESGGFLPLVTRSNVQPGTKFGGRSGKDSILFMAATPDLSHVVLQSPAALTQDAINGEEIYVEGGQLNTEANLYEWSGGRLQLVNILPNGEPVIYDKGIGVTLAGYKGSGAVAHAISSDGRYIAWELGSELYVRDMVGEKTFRVGGPSAQLQTMSGDGAEVFYIEGGDLYAFDTRTATPTDITANLGVGEGNAGVRNAVLGASEDGSYVYFVATGVLAKGAVSGEDNLYASHYGDGGWTTIFVGTLSAEDEKSWYSHQAGESALMLPWVSSRVSPDGRYLAFMSSRSLTGYDNIDALSGQPDEEVYLYDAVAGRLVCASCNPTGARPVGTLDTPGGSGSIFFGALMVDRPGSWTSAHAGIDHWLAGSVPGWDELGNNITAYQPRYLSDSGRLFFDSPDALVPQDTNGLEDVYEYEPAGMGSCTTASATFGVHSQGCVSLLSSGTSSAESVFYDASENGDDAFFVTVSKLVPEDYDTGNDVYDAHVCSMSVPCRTSPVSPPPCTSGDSCKAAPSPQPEIFGPAPSATFSGVGNVASSHEPVIKPKSLTQAQRLAQALRTCRKKRSKGKRVMCEREAHRRLKVKQARSVKTTGRGNR